MARARVGERQADGQAEPRRGGVDADEALGVVDPGDRRERRAPGQRRGDAARGPSPDAAARAREIAGSSKHPLLVPPFEPHRARRVVPAAPCSRDP